MDRRCIWTRAADGDLVRVEVETVDRFGRDAGKRVFFVRREHEQDFRRFNDRLRRFGARFLGLVGLSSLLVLGAVPLAMLGRPPVALLAAAAGTAMLGLIVIVLPFSTPETVRWLGLRRSIATARVLGLVCVASGAALAALAVL